MPIRIVVDPNIWIAALISNRDDSMPVLLYHMVLSGDVIAVVSPHLLNELTEVARRPKFRQWFTTEDAQTFVSDLASVAELHPDTDTPSVRCRDPKDDYLLALMETAGALLVTGDKDLLDMAQTRIPVVSLVGLSRLLDPSPEI